MNLRTCNKQNDPATQSEGENSNDSKVDNSDASSNSKFEFENVTNEDVGDVKGSKYMDD